jgi:hypothetical protein
MRTGTLLCSQTTERLEPLGAFNQPVYRSYGQIRATLLNELGPLHADYFARPDTDQSGRNIGWLAHQLGDARRWVDLSPGEQGRLQPVLQRVRDGFAEYQSRLEAAPANSPRNNFSKLLAQALLTPSDDYLYFIGEQPALAFWGFKTMKAAQGVDPLRLLAGATVIGGTSPVSPATSPSTPLSAVIGERRRRWWPWLLLLGLLLLLAALLGYWYWRGQIGRQQDVLRDLIPRILHPKPTIPPNLPGDNRATVPVVKPPGADLVTPVRPPGPDVITPVPPRETISPPPVRPPGTDVVTPVRPPGGNVQGVEIQNNKPPPVGPQNPGGVTQPSGPSATLPDLPIGPGKTQGQLPPFPLPGQLSGPQGPIDRSTPVPSGLPPLPPLSGSAAHTTPLTIPPDPSAASDFVQGVWRSRSGLMLNGKPAEEYYRFDKNGQGDVTLRTRDGSRECSGPAQAAIGADRHLSFKEATELTCSDGSTVAGAVTDCVQRQGHATCQGTNGDGSQFGVQIEGVQGQ